MGPAGQQVELPTDSFWKGDPELSPPAGLHYHKAVEPSGELSLTGAAIVDGVIQEVNAAIRSVWKEFTG